MTTRGAPREAETGAAPSVAPPPPATDARGLLPLTLGPLLATSWRTCRAHPVVSAALGAAVVFSTAAIGFGVGVFVTPWFVCEIFALQLAILTEQTGQRTVGWLRAGALVLAMACVVIAATGLAVLVIGPDVSTADSAAAPLPWPEAALRGGLIVAVTFLTIGFIAPFQYAPLILIDRGGNIASAILESAWLARRGGLLRHVGLAFLAHVLPLAPAIVAAVVVARTFERAATPVGVLLGLPLLPLSIPLGQGLVTAAYVSRRHALCAPRWVRAAGRPPRALVALLGVLVLAPMLSVGLLFLGALRQAPPVEGHAPAGVLVVQRVVSPGRPVRFGVRDTTLEISVAGRDVRVTAGDGGGVGALPAVWRQDVSRVRVLRRGEVYAVEITTAEGAFWVALDRAASRVDDAVAARLRARLPVWALPAIALAFALDGLLLARALEPWGDVRRAFASPRSTRAVAVELRTRRAAATRTAWIIGAVLSVPAALAVAGALIALVG